MIGKSRREVLRLAVQAAATVGVAQLVRPRSAWTAPAAAAAPATTPVTGSTPRYFLRVMMSGGIDPIYTVDPKTRSQVEPWVDRPYTANEIVEVGGIRLGPHFKQLASHAKRIAFLNSVEVETVAHQPAFVIALAMSQTPTALPLHDVIGLRANTLLPSLCLGPSLGVEARSPFYFGSHDRLSIPKGGVADPDPHQIGLIDYLSELEPDDVKLVADALRKDAESMRKLGSEGHKQVAWSLDRAAKAAEVLPTVPRFQQEVWSSDPLTQMLSKNFQRAAWAFENDVAAAIHLRIGSHEWDSHYDNAERQQTMNSAFCQAFTGFLDLLEKRSNRYGTLGSNTLVLASSEMGRHPRINRALGKDHFPEVSYMLAGAGIAGGRSHGHTDRRMAARPLNLETGKPDRKGRVVRLEDLGATILEIMGYQDGRRFGYRRGRLLNFLLAS